MLSRRKFLKTSVATAAAASAIPKRAAFAREGEPMIRGGRDYSFLSGTKRKAIPTTCALCPSRCPAIGYVEEGYVVKVEGQPGSIRTRGLLCAKGQAGVNQVYDPDRILFPMKRAGKRGEGKWERITWDEALTELANRLGKLRDNGHPERFMFHHGWISASADRLINKVFLPTYGTGTVASNSCHDQSARRAAHELTWGGREDSWDFEHTRYVLNFGSNVLEAHANHVALAHRLALALADRRVKMVTFDVRLSNTASKSQTWIQVAPGSDLAVALAMCQVVMSENLYRGDGENFLKFCKVSAEHNAPVDDKVAILKAHLAPFTPDWAAGISGVDASQIRDIAVEFATTKPACVISSRGAVAHYNGVETERAIQMLAAITGNIDNPGGRCLGVAAEWNYPTGPKDKPVPRSLDILHGLQGAAALPASCAKNQALAMIKDGRADPPEVFLWYNHNPVFTNADVQQNIDILKDETLIPLTVCVSPFYDESAALADLILPDATYLERYDFEEGISPDQVAEYSICQPIVPPLGEARDFKDVCCGLAERMGFPLGFKSAQEFVKAAFTLTPEVKKGARSFKRMAKRGVWHNPDAQPAYYSYKRIVAAEELQQEGVIFDEAAGVYWNWQVAGAMSEGESRSKGYGNTPGAWKGYVGQQFGDVRRHPSKRYVDQNVYRGFAPSRINKSGYFELYSTVLKENGFESLPTYIAIPEHQEMTPDQLILTTYKVIVQTRSRTENCKWLSEIHHDNPAWINPATADPKGIADGDRIRIVSEIGEMETTAKVTELVAPGVIAVSSHGGRWEYGRYASGKRAPYGVDDPPHEEHKWWQANRAHPNWIIPVSCDPISGQQRWMDTVVSVVKT